MTRSELENSATCVDAGLIPRPLLIGKFTYQIPIRVLLSDISIKSHSYRTN